MKFVKEESFLIDYLNSFELVALQDDLKENRTILDKVIDENYKKKIQAYVESINDEFNNSVIRYFIGEDFNLLFSIANYKYVASFEELVNALTNFTLDELYEIFSEVFDVKTSFNLWSIDTLPLSFEDKWKLAIIINEFHEVKQKLLLALPLFYAKYKQYAEDLYSDYYDKITQIESVSAEKDFLYRTIFKEYLDKNVFDTIEKRLILLISAHKILVYRTKKYSLIAMGLYVLDFHLEVERQKKIDEVKLNQILKSLADPTRYGIIKKINQGITSNSVLADIFSVSRAAISMQFKYLQANDIISIDEVTKQYVVNKDIIKHAIELVQLDMDLLDN